MKRVFIIHGWGGYPEEGWFPWLKKRLEEKGFTVQVPAMPDSDHPRLEAWLGKINEILDNPDKDTFFVGHSLGCYTIAKYIERLPEGICVGGVIFVAGFGGGLNYPEIRPYYKEPIDWEKIKNRSGFFIAVHSDDDPDVPLEKSRELEQKLGAKLIIEHGKGHYGESDNVKELPVVLEELLKIIEK